MTYKTVNQRPLVVQRRSKLQALAERGLTTVEYAIGLVAAATVALVLVRIFNDNKFFKALFDMVTDALATTLASK